MELPPHFIATTETQLGVFARRQLTRYVPDHHADDLLRGRWCERLQRGVYRIVGGARAAEQAAIAAALRAGPRSVLTGPVALHLMDVDGLRGDDPFTILAPAGRHVTNVDFPVRQDPDPARAVAKRGEVRIAGPVDALIDSAEYLDQLGARRLSLAHDVLRWRGLLAPGRLAERIRELGPRVSAGPALDHLLDLDGAAEVSGGERALGDLLGRFDPAPEPQVWVTPGRRVDWYFRSLRYGYEYQGSVDHGTVARRAADGDRDAELRRSGIRLGYVTAADLADEVVLLGTVAGALAVRGHELGVTPPVLRPA